MYNLHMQIYVQMYIVCVFVFWHETVAEIKWQLRKDMQAFSYIFKCNVGKYIHMYIPMHSGACENNCICDSIFDTDSQTQNATVKMVESKISIKVVYGE